MSRYLCAASVATLSLVPQAILAAVTFTGTVSPGSPIEVDDSTSVVIGPDFNSEGTEDPRGAIVVDQGSTFVAQDITVGANDSALASMRVSGPGTTVRLTSGMQLGLGGSSYLRIEDGAWVDIGSINRQGSLVIAVATTAGPPFPTPAHVEVDGAGSLLTVGGSLSMGQGLDTRLSITNGGVARVGYSRNSVYLSGLVEVNGERSELQVNDFVLGEEFNFEADVETGELRIGEGAFVRSSGFDQASARIGYGSRIVLDGGTLALRIDRLDGSLQGSGVVTKDIEFSGRVEVGAGDHLELRGSLVGDGAVHVEDGELEIAGDFEITNSGEFLGSAAFIRSDVRLLRGMTSVGPVRVTDSHLRIGRDFGIDNSTIQVLNTFVAEGSRVEWKHHSFNSGRMELTETEFVIGRFTTLTNQTGGRVVLQDSTVGGGNSQCCRGSWSNEGVIEVRGDRNQIATQVNGSGSLLVLSESEIDLLYSDFQQITVGAGGQVRSIGDLRTAELALTINDRNRERASVVVQSHGGDGSFSQLLFNGRLVVEAAGLTSLAADQEFLLIKADRLWANLSDYELPALPGTLEFLPQLTDTTLSLLVIDTTEMLPGDFNGDGFVNAADYTVWRDGDLPGGSRSLELALWRNNFGRTLSLPGADAVPEPLSVVVALLAVSVGVGFRRPA